MLSKTGGKQPTNSSLTASLFDIDDVRLVPEKFAAKNRKLIDLQRSSGPHRVVLFNSQLGKRNEIVSLRINSPDVQVIDLATGLPLDRIQISLIWPNSDGEPLDWFASYIRHDDIGFDPIHYELLFEIEIDGLSTRTFAIKATDKPAPSSPSQVNFYLRESVDLDKVIPER